MQFNLLPVLDMMIALYRNPRDAGRFKAYINLLQGDTPGDLSVPVSGYNPMAKPHVLEKLLMMQQINAESMVADVLQQLNRSLNTDGRVFKVALTLADDAQGGWTNRYTTDYDSKFKLNGLLARNFCTPIVWTSEEIGESLIKRRTLEYCYRTLYRSLHPQPLTLQDHLRQEHWVTKKTGGITLATPNVPFLLNVYAGIKQETAYPVIFNFLYGDEAATQMGYLPMGVAGSFTGYQLAGIMNEGDL